jgi:flotillin
MMKTVPPLNDLFNMAGLNLPTYLKGDDKPEEGKSTTSNKITTPTEEQK